MVKKIHYILISTIFFVLPLYSMTTPDVTVMPDSTNTYSQYSITASIFNASSATIRANVDSLFIRFNSYTTVPASINSAYILVNNTASNAVSVQDTIISILSPVNIPRGGSFTINVRIQAQVKNPSSAGDYYLYLMSDRGPDANGWEQSSAYTIAASNSNVSRAAITPDPSVASEHAQYTIGFNLGLAGALTAGEGTINIAFPSLTGVPNGSISGVTLNGTSAITTALDDTVYITTPVDVDNSGSVEVIFLSGAGLTNPSVDSTYTMSISTSTEINYVTSDPYTVSPAGQLSITAISTKPDTVNEGGAFSFNFRTGSSGALAANIDTIYVIFPQNTYLPLNMSTSNVSVSSGGFSNSAASIVILKSNSADDDTVALVTPINVGSSSDVTLEFAQAAGYLNPSIAGNYTLNLKTSQDQSTVESNPYAVLNTQSQVSQPLVTPTSNGSAAATSYTVDFNLGHFGRLISGLSTITLDFDDNHTLSSDSADYSTSTISVAEGSAITIPWSNMAVNTTDDLIQITIPESVDPLNGNNIVVYLSGESAQPITNPTAGNYTMLVKTSVEATDVASATYNIGGIAITLNSVAFDNYGVNQISQDTFNITTSLALQNPGGQGSDDFITIIFPEGTVLPSTITNSDIRLNGFASQSVQVNQTNRTVVATINVNIDPSTFDVVILSSANIRNPSVPSSTFYKVTISTSQEEVPVTSSAYNIIGNNTQSGPVSMSVNPFVVNAADAVFTLSFTTSSVGKIAGGRPAGSSTITVNFDTATVVPASISASTVQINSTPLQNLTIDSTGAGGVITLQMPNGITIDTSATASVLFTSASGLDNGSTAGTYKVKVKTSSDTLYSSITGTDGDYMLSAAQDLSISSVLTSPTTQNANASYSISLTTGSSGALSIGDSIEITFPTNTYLPSTMSSSEVLINGNTPTQNPTISGQVLTLVTPVTISNLTSVTILINLTAGILNPTQVQSYTLQVSTSTEAGPFTSPSYNITTTASTVDAADVTVTTPSTGTATPYTVDFSIGSNGRLLAGTSTITITFGAATGVSTNYSLSTISVNGGTAVFISSDITVSEKQVIITIPSGVTISNSDQVSVYLAGATDPITNPSSEGSYTLQVSTSVETDNITSNTYNISNVAAVTSVTASQGNAMVNEFTNYSASFDIANTLTTINITFPFNTLVPAVISTANVTVNGSPADAVSTNPATRRITITESITGPTTVTVVFAQGAGIQNPSVLGDYTLSVNTNSQPINGTSGTYTLTAATSSISNIQISVTPEAVSEIGEYAFSFLTGDNGRLISGTSQIYILFPYDATFTQGTPGTSKILVNSTAAAAVSLIEGSTSNPDTLIITVPSTVTVNNNSSVNVNIDASSGIQNASSGASLTYSLYTSVEKGQVDADHSLPVELSSFSAVSAEGSIRLNWVTESELRNAYWIIDRCEIPEEHAEEVETDPNKITELGLDFNRIRRINGAGTVSKRTEYLMNDSLVVGGHVYAYRLTDVSYNGVMTRHEVIVQRVETPDEFSLSQNYPNPFNPQTTIPFRLKTTAEVQIKIYNILGQEIITLVNGQMEAGFYNKIWNGFNNFGQRVSSGVYFYLLTAKTAEGHKLFRQAKKMMMLK